MATRTQPPTGTAPTDSVESDTPVDQLPMAPDVELETDTVDLDRVATHPANPRKVLGDLSDLIPSVRTQGVLHPPVVLPADRVAAAWPEHAKALADVDWVVLIGARRRAAAIEAGRTRLPVLIRRDAIADDRLAQLDAMLAENTARRPLSPVEEARAFAGQLAAGRRQHEVAARAGRSQSHISKRVTLLKLPPQMLAELDTGQHLDDGEDHDDDQDTTKKPLEIQDALAYVKAAGGDQFVMLAAYKLHQHRPHWSADELCREVQRERARRTQHEALANKAAAEGVPLIEDPAQRFGGYWGAREQRLDGKKAIATARKAGTLAAHVTDGGLVYYSTAGKPRKADNRSEAEEKRITDERERRRAMTARAEAAAGLAARPPKLPETAADIVDAWLWAPGNDVAQLAHKWLLAAGVGPDPNLPAYQWWEQVRTADWPTRVHAAHALALARHEVNTRATYRTWSERDAAWLTRLREQAGYAPTPWEQARLDAIGQQPPAPKRPEGASLAYDDEDSQCWVLYFDLEVDDPAAWAEHLEDPEAVDDAKAWAEQLLHDEYGIEVTDWKPGRLLPGYPAHIAVFAAADNVGGEPVDRADAAATGHIEQHGDVLRCAHCGAVSDSIHADGDPLKAVVRFTDHHHACQPAAPAPAGPGEYRLLHSVIDDVWMLLRGDEHLADHDGLDEDDLDGACAWASQVVADDTGRHVEGWQARAGIGDGGVEHVAEFAPDATPASRS